MVDGFKSVSINLETYDLLAQQAERNYRTIAAQIRYLVEREESVVVYPGQERGDEEKLS